MSKSDSFPKSELSSIADENTSETRHIVLELLLAFPGLSVRSAFGNPLDYQFEQVVAPTSKSHGAVASESTICSQIGVDLIRHGVRNSISTWESSLCRPGD